MRVIPPYYVRRGRRGAKLPPLKLPAPLRAFGWLFAGCLIWEFAKLGWPTLAAVIIWFAMNVLFP